MASSGPRRETPGFLIADCLSKLQTEFVVFAIKPARYQLMEIMAQTLHVATDAA
jgi:hypothetical protein